MKPSDTERLDWLDENIDPTNLGFCPGEFDFCRDAIDHALNRDDGGAAIGLQLRFMNTTYFKGEWQESEYEFDVIGHDDFDRLHYSRSANRSREVVWIRHGAEQLNVTVPRDVVDMALDIIVKNGGLRHGED